MASAARFTVSAVILSLATVALAQTTTPSTTKPPTPSITAVSECHGHGTTLFVWIVYSC